MTPKLTSVDNQKAPGMGRRFIAKSQVSAPLLNAQQGNAGTYTNNNTSAELREAGDELEHHLEGMTKVIMV